MSTSSTHRRADVAAAGATNAEAHEARIAASEAALQQAVKTARAAVTVAEAAAVASMTLRDEDTNDKDGARPRSPHRRHNISPSPVRRRGSYHCRDSLPVVQCVIKESDGSTPWPMLTKTNYNDWSLLMKVKL
jgi:hypothetical protein